MKNFILKSKEEALKASACLNDGRWSESGYARSLTVKAICASMLFLSLSRLVYMRIINKPAITNILKKNGKLIFVLWHGDLVTATCTLKGYKPYVMTSLSKDGDLLAKILTYMGYGIIRGSSHRGGIKAILDMIGALNSFLPCLISVDGPKGPRREVKPGAVMIAKKANAPIIAIGFAYSNCTQLNNWDKTVIPIPFSRAFAYAQGPFFLPETASREACREIIKDKLFKAEAAAKKALKFGESA